MVESQKHNIVKRQLSERYVQYDNIYEKSVQYKELFFWVYVYNVIYKAHISQTHFLIVVGWQLKEKKKWTGIVTYWILTLWLFYYLEINWSKTKCDVLLFVNF